MHIEDTEMTMIYPAVNALSLNLISATLVPDPFRPTVTDTKYLDRISYSPDIDETFGRHLFVADDRYQHILYPDREAEENTVLKWLSKTRADESWWIDAFPDLAEPLTAVPRADGALEVLFTEGSSLSLYRLPPGGQPAQLASTAQTALPVLVKGTAYAVGQGDTRAYSVYDDLSKRLYLIHPQQGALQIEPVYASAEVHHTTTLGDRLSILLFDPGESTIFLLQRPHLWDEAAENRIFDVLPVTLCEGTSSVFLADHRGQHLILFDERIIGNREKTTHQLSLLYPGPAGTGYGKTVLAEGEEAIQGVKAQHVGDVLYILILRSGELTLQTVRLEGLIRNP
jgi:hypothetical protein